MTNWTRITAGTEDGDDIIVAAWVTPDRLEIRTGWQQHGEICVSVVGLSGISLSAAEVSRIPPQPGGRKR